MKNFLAMYLGSAASMAAWNQLSEEERKQRQALGLQAWHQWMERNRASVVETGSPLGRTKRISASGIADTRNDMAGFVVVRAESHEAAAKLFEGHPHFAIFPGEAIEVMECLPIPGM